MARSNKQFFLILSLLFLTSILSGCSSERELDAMIEISHKDSFGNLKPAINGEYSLNDEIYLKFNINGLENNNKKSRLKIIYFKIADQNGDGINLMQNELIDISNISSYFSGSYSRSFSVRGDELGKGCYKVYLKAQDLTDGEIKTETSSFCVRDFFYENLLRNISVIAIAFIIGALNHKDIKSSGTAYCLSDIYRGKYLKKLLIGTSLMFLTMIFQESMQLRIFYLSSIGIFLISAFVIPTLINQIDPIKPETKSRINEEERQRFYQEQARREYEERRRAEEGRRKEEKAKSGFSRNPKEITTDELLSISNIVRQYPTRKDIQKQRRKYAKKFHPDAAPEHLKDSATEAMQFYNAVFDELLVRFNHN